MRQTERHQHDAASTLEAGSAERHAASNLEAGSAERQVKARFAASFYRRSESNVWHSGLPAAGPIRPSLPWCFSAAAPSLDLRAVPDESHLQDAASNLEAGSAERQVKATFATSFSAFRKQTQQAIWKLAVPNGR